MKKTYIALAVLAMAALAGCQTEEFRNDVYIPEEGEVLIRVSKSDKTTKSAELSSELRGESFSLGSDAEGTNYVLEETITNLDDLAFAPATKGTPGYTENFADLYKGFNAAVYKGTNVYEVDGAFTEVDKAKLIYKRKYPDDIWDKKNEETPNLYFFLRTPANYIDANTSGLTYSATDGTISFTYTSPNTDGVSNATDLKDMLFTSRPLKTAAEFNNFFIKADEGLPVLFHHALTGVKFAIAADVKDKVTITGVKFTGLADGGKCVVTPRQETNGYVDDKTGDYSSDSVSVWNPSDLVYGGTEFSQTFSGVVSYESAGTGVAHFGDSFYLAGNNNNLNDANASETFWFVPQPMIDNVKLTISYKIGDAAQPDWAIDFGTILKNKNVTWKAGELHTYTIRIDDVDVKIEDIVNVVSSDASGTDEGQSYTYTSYTGSSKTDVKIKNTGDTDAFIRVALTGQWLEEDTDEIVFGYTDFKSNVFKAVESWYEDQFVTKHRQHGKFQHLAGYDTASDTLHNWKKINDYWYYMKPVPAGEYIPTKDSLFYKYTVGVTPATRVAGDVKDVYFQLEIATQAISAKKPDGSDYTFEEAWENAQSK